MSDPIKCTECGGSFRLDDDRAVLFCPYCGAEIPKEESNLDKILRSRRNSQKLKSETRIRLAEESTTRKKAELEAQVIRERIRHKAKKGKDDDAPWWIGLVIFFGCLLFIAFLIVFLAKLDS